MIFLPRLLMFATEQSQQLTPLESFLALHFGLFFASSAIGLVINVMALLDASPICDTYQCIDRRSLQAQLTPDPTLHATMARRLTPLFYPSRPSRS